MALIEPDGVCGASHPSVKSIDWNGNGIIDAAPVAAFVKCAGIWPARDHDDFAAMSLTSSLSSFGKPIAESAVCAELP